MLVHRREPAQIRPVGERQVHRGVRARIAEVTPVLLREDLVGQLCRPGHRDIDVEDLVVGVPATGRGLATHVVQRRHPGPADVGPGGGTGDRSGADHRRHVRRRDRGGGQQQLGKLGAGVPGVCRDVQPVVGEGRGVRDRVLAGLETAGEALVGPGVEGLPGGPVRRALQLPALRVACRRVVGGRQRVGDDRGRLGQLVGHPGSGCPRKPLGVDVAVGQVLGQLVRCVLLARGDLHDGAGDISREADRAGRQPVHRRARDERVDSPDIVRTDLELRRAATVRGRGEVHGERLRLPGQGEVVTTDVGGTAVGVEEQLAAPLQRHLRPVAGAVSEVAHRHLDPGLALGLHGPVLGRGSAEGGRGRDRPGNGADTVLEGTLPGELTGRVAEHVVAGG